MLGGNIFMFDIEMCCKFLQKHIEFGNKECVKLSQNSILSVVSAHKLPILYVREYSVKLLQDDIVNVVSACNCPKLSGKYVKCRVSASARRSGAPTGRA